MAEASNDDCEWLEHVKESLEKDEVGASETRSRVCIFGIAHPLLRLKPEAYIPQAISIGPYHYRRLQQYEETDTYKLKMAHALEKEVPGFKFRMLVKQIESFDDQIRACYHKDISYSKEMLSWMLALDTSFILQFLKSFCQLDPILLSKRKTPLWYSITNDILMLENQVPMFLLREALCFTANYIQSDTLQKRENLACILQGACLHFNPFVRENNLPPLKLETARHILDSLYHYVTAASPEPEQSESQVYISLERRGINTLFKRMLSATELSEAGIKFASYSSGDLSKICFNSTTSTLLLPKITVNDCTEVVLRNLVELELNLKTKQKPLTSYIYLMDSLIDTEKDVAVLKRHGIHYSQMGSDAEVAHMWKSMIKSIWESTFDPVDQAIDKAIEAANKYYGSKWRILSAEFQKTHCSKPWLIISVLSAGVLLLLTAVQVFCLFYTCKK